MRISLDTNVLVRVFVNDEGSLDQSERARALCKEAKEIYVPQVVQAELVWVLEGAFHLKKADIVSVLKKLGFHTVFSLQEPEAFHQALAHYELGKADFSDYLIGVMAQTHQAILYSFDKKLVRSELAKTPASFPKSAV